MSIEDIWEKIKGLRDFKPNFQTIPDDLFLGLIIIFIAFGSFGLGRLSKIEGAKTPIRIENAPEITPDTFQGTAKIDSVATPKTLSTDNQKAELVGSKTGAKYHYTWCPGAQKIAEANRIYFASKADADARGYTPASNCKGL